MEKYDGKLSIDEINIGEEFLCLETNQISTITNKTANSVETYDLANQKSRDKDGRLKGINAKNWHELSWFNRKYKKI